RLTKMHCQASSWIHGSRQGYKCTAAQAGPRDAYRVFAKTPLDMMSFQLLKLSRTDFFFFFFFFFFREISNRTTSNHNLVMDWNALP
uniref:Uncharacterized protein n=1 Tax=Aegilops tauschii subsp. strangulata TaxID=200361 RepID=A0A453BLB3_AEGTS